MIRKLAMVCIIMILVTACARGPEGDLTGVGNEEIGSPPGTVTDDHTLDPGEVSDSPTEGDDADAGNEPIDEPDVNRPDDAEEPVDVDPAPIEKTYYMNSIYDIKPLDEDVEDKVVLLTFDDGPKELDMITSLLDVLDQHDAKAIFFVNGYRVKAKPELLTMIHDRGHVIGNHSWDHINLKLESEDKIKQQVDDVQAIVEQTVGIKPQFFRPPHGSSNEYLRSYVKEQGMLFMTWSNGSRLG